MFKKYVCESEQVSCKNVFLHAAEIYCTVWIFLNDIATRQKLNNKINSKLYLNKTKSITQTETTTIIHSETV